METATRAGAPEAELKFSEGFFASRDDLRLYWRSLAPRDSAAVRGHVALMHGYAEHSGRYREAMQVLAQAGLAVHAVDYRGHGQSDGRRTHVDRWEQYLDDLDVLWEHVRRAADQTPCWVLGHSLGALIAARWALGRREGPKGIVLLSPFLALAFQPNRLKVLAGRLADKVVPWLPIPNELKVEQLTRDKEIQGATTRDPLYLHTTTPRWYLETTRVQAEVLARASELTLPCLVAAGMDDPIADPRATQRFFDRIGSADKTLKLYPGMLHELLNEVGRPQVHAELLAWLRSHGA